MNLHPSDKFQKIFDPRELSVLRSRVLFYPCASQDLLKPIKLFTPWIDTFWFVDTGYFSQEDPWSSPPIISFNKQFHLLNKEVSIFDLPNEDLVTDQRYQGIPCFIVKEYYQYLPNNAVITVIRHRRRGPSALRTEIDKLGVFFYRGDSPEGSGTMWLTAWRKRRNNGSALPLQIIEKLVDGGYIITDGSMCEIGGNPYNFLYLSTLEIKQTGSLEKTIFQDPFCNNFEYSGIVGYRYDRATLAWKIHKN